MILLLGGCGKFNLTPEININFQDATDVSETGFTLGWSVSTSDYTALTVILSTDPSFNNIIETREFQDKLVKATTFTDLNGATTYYFRISLERGPGSLYISDTKSIELPFQQDKISFATPDSLTLVGNISYLSSLEFKRPGIIMMHEFGVFVNGWANSEMLKALVADGYVCLFFFNRGHGQSGSIDNIQVLTEDPTYLINDLLGAMTFMSAHEKVTSDSLGLMGGSMGGSMSVAGNGADQVHTSVALSPSTMHTSAMHPGIQLKSIFYLVGENDVVNTGNGTIDFPAEANALYNLTENPKKIKILENTSAHGTALLESEGVLDEIRLWFQVHLPVNR
jgi:dienelactone hydrolase